MTELQPRCPHCNARGLNNLIVEQAHQFNLVFCGKCGAIHGVLPLSPAASDAQQLQPIQHTEVPAWPKITPPSIPPNPTPKEPEAPLCPQHHLTMTQRIVPAGHPDAGQQIWLCPKFKECNQWQKVENKVESPVNPIEVSHQAVPDPLAEIGNADLSQKQPYDPAAMVNRMRAAGLSRSSRYLQIAIDAGPPCCPQHKLDMVKATVPAGYKNAGRKVWLCPKYQSCQQWELVESPKEPSIL